MSDKELELSQEDENIITIVDDDGTNHYFDEIDRIMTDDGRKYIAILELLEDDEEIITIEDEDEEEGVIILKVLEENGENYLVQIDNEKEFNEIGTIFEDRLIAKFEEEQN
ncbi:MAG: DUF1292 domain-containing protein [Clostridia bacterium]